MPRKGGASTAKDAQMPDALQLVRALSNVLSAKLNDFGAELIELDRDEVALCLGIINAVIDSLEAEAGQAN